MYPFLWFPLCGAYIILFHFKISPRTHIFYKLTLSHIIEAYTLVVLATTICAFVLTWRSAEFPPLVKGKANELDNAGNLWLAATLAGMVMVILVFTRSTVGATILLPLHFLDLIVYYPCLHLRNWSSFRSKAQLARLVDFVVLEKEDRFYAGRYTTQVKAAYAPHP